MLFRCFSDGRDGSGAFRMVEEDPASHVRAPEKHPNHFDHPKSTRKSIRSISTIRIISTIRTQHGWGRPGRASRSACAPKIQKTNHLVTFREICSCFETKKSRKIHILYHFEDFVPVLRPKDPAKSTFWIILEDFVPVLRPEKSRNINFSVISGRPPRPEESAPAVADISVAAWDLK